MAEIVTFRPVPEVQDILSKIKEEGSSVGKYINNSIVSASSGSAGPCTIRISAYYMEGDMQTMVTSDALEAQRMVALSVPVGQLSARRYSEFKEALKGCGMEHFYFRLNADHVIGIISTSLEEASVEFSKYFIRDPETKEYVRTMLPLPQIRYEISQKAAIIVTKEPNL